MRSFTRVLAGLAFTFAAVASRPVAAADDTETDPIIAAAERAKKQAEAKTAQYEAEEAEHKAEQAAAEARWGFLPKSPAEGKTTLDSSGAALETELLVADTLGSAADEIIRRMPVGPILVVEGTGSQGGGRLIAFQAEAYGLRNASRRALGSGELCPPPPGPGTQPVKITGGPAIGALIGGLSDMLKTDTAIHGRTSTLGEAQLVRAIVAKKPTRFRTAYFDAGKMDPENPVIVELECLGKYRDAITAKLASFDTDDRKKANAEQIARLAAQALAYDDLLDRLIKVEKDSPPLLALLYADSEISKSTGSVLRVWVDAKGGTVITRRSLWTTLGAPSVSMTGGAVISYLLVHRGTGQTWAAGLLRCNTKLTTLRGAHQLARSIGRCEPIAKPESGS